MKKKPTKRQANSGPQLVAAAVPQKPSAPLRLSGAETKMKQNVAEGRTGEAGVKVLTRLQELELRSHYLQAKLLEAQYTQARERHMAQFDRAPEAVQTMQQIKEAGELFNAALDAVHKKHGTSNETHVYDMDAKELRPKDKPSTVPEPDTKPVPVAATNATEEVSDVKKEGGTVEKRTTDT